MQRKIEFFLNNLDSLWEGNPSLKIKKIGRSLFKGIFLFTLLSQFLLKINYKIIKYNNNNMKTTQL